MGSDTLSTCMSSISRICCLAWCRANVTRARWACNSPWGQVAGSPPHGRRASFVLSTRLPQTHKTVAMSTSDAVQINSGQDGLSLAAVGQMTSCGDATQNFAVCQELAEDARRQGASILFLPECFSFIGMSPQEAVAVAEPLDGPIMRRYRELARHMGIWLSLGGFQEQGPDDKHLHNCHVIISSAGDIVAAYRKVHLFDVDVPDGPILMESRSTAPGDALVACDSPVGRLGLSICYDLRFPEVYQHLAFSMGAQVLLVPSAFTKVTGEAHWEVLLRARAIETQCYVIAAAQAGQHNGKRQSYGHSLIIDPWGRVVGRLEDPEATGIAVATIDLQALANIRTRMPIVDHRLNGRNCLGWVEDDVVEPESTNP